MYEHGVDVAQGFREIQALGQCQCRNPAGEGQRRWTTHRESFENYIHF